MITYKGFEKGLVCRGYQFTAGIANVCEKAKTAREGFHSAENPLDVLTYYPDPETSEYWMCTVGGDIDEDGNDSKVSSTEITPMHETQLNEATAKIKELEETAEREPEQLTMEATVSEEALQAQREKIAEEIRADIRAEYEKKLAAAANPDVQRCTMHFEAFCSDFQKMVKALSAVPEENREKIRENVRGVLARMTEEFHVE